jgi:hypothetical protein
MGDMATPTAVDDHELPRSECWCCGTVDDPDRMIHLGNHPEVALCLACGRWAAKQAGEIEDRARTGPLVMARDRLRHARATVIGRGLHRNRILGRPLRWLGRRLP